MVSENWGEQALDWYRTMVTIREFEETVRRLHLSGQAPGLVHLCSGQEAVATGVCAALRQDDCIASHHRGHGHCIAKGADLVRLLAEILGRVDGYCKGRSGSMHIYDARNGNLGTNGIVGGGIPLATGAALAARTRGKGQVAVAFFGDGALNQGLLFECLNLAAIWALPVVFVCEDNRFGEFTESRSVTAGDYPDRARAFGIPAAEVDGMDVVAVYAAAGGAVDRARQGDGPTMLLCETYRYSGHHISDKQEYKEDAERERWLKRDPIPRLAQRMADAGLATASDLEQIAAESRSRVSAAADQALQSAVADADCLAEHLYGA